MFRLFVLALLALASVPAGALPGTITYQGRLLGNDDQPVEGAIKLHVRFFRDRIPGDAETALHQESFDLTARGGLIAVELGKAGLPPTLFDEDAWIELQIEGGPALAPRLRVTAAPYAFRAAKAAEALKAALADKALEADHAKAADEATHALAADRATAADSATSATTAGHATTADSAQTAASAATASVADALSAAAQVPAAQVQGKVSAAAAADTLGGKSFADLQSTFAATTHAHSAADLSSGTLDVARLANGSITKEKLAPDAVTSAGFTPAGNLAATSVGAALRELDGEKTDLAELPVGPNYLKDTRTFKNLALNAQGAEVFDTWVNLSAAKDPWSFVDHTQGQGLLNRARVRKTSSESLRASPSNYPDLGTAATVLGGASASWTGAGYTNFAIAEFDIDGSTTQASGRSIAYMRQGCPHQGASYGARTRVSTQAFVKVQQIPTNMRLTVGSNGWPGKAFDAPTADWEYINVTNANTGGCIDPFWVTCTGACSGTLRFAIALPYIASGRRSGFAWAGYAPWITDDMP